MKLKDVKLHCRVCNKEIPLSVFQKTGMMGLHDQFNFIDDICATCKEESIGEDSDLSGQESKPNGEE